MTKALVATLIVLAMGCGESDPASIRKTESANNDKAANQTPTSNSQDPIRPPASWRVQTDAGPRVTELTLGRKPDGPWKFQPRYDDPEWDASLPTDWAADPFEDLNWQHHLHSWRSMEFWLNEFLQTNDVGLLRHPVDIALDWHRFHIEEDRISHLQWYDDATGVRASRLAFLLEFILKDEIEVSGDNLARLMNLADLHVEKLMDPEFLSSNNHGLFQMVGLDALCAVVGWRRACNGAREYARNEFVRLIRSWYTEEGINVESSPTYHYWVTRKIRELGAAERFRHPDVVEILDQADEVSPWLTYPDGRWVRVGDSHGEGPKLTGPVPSTCLPEGGGCWAVRDLSKSGYALVRSLPEVEPSRSSMLFVGGTMAPTGHKHADDLGFVLIEDGQDIFIDSGRYGYNYDAARKYVLSARAHNIPSLVGRRIDPYVIDPDKSHLGPLRVEEGQFTISGVVDRPWLLVHERKLSYIPGVMLRIEDKLDNRTESQWQSNIHLAPGLIPEISETGFVITAGELTVQAEFSGEGCRISAVRGETDPYQGWVSAGYLELAPASVVVATCPADLAESSWHITFER